MTDPVFHRTLGFRLLSEGDLPRLVTWMRTSHVAQWWHPVAPAEIEAKYLSRLRGETGVRVCAILLGLEPVGMVQVAPLEGAGRPMRAAPTC